MRAFLLTLVTSQTNYVSIHPLSIVFLQNSLFLESIPLTTREEEDQLLNDGYKFIRYDTKHEEVVLTKRL